MAKSGLEDRLEEITRAFVAQIVSALRNASFAEVASLQVTAAGARPGRSRAPRPATRVSASPSGVDRAARSADAPSPAPARIERGQLRQTADRRAELAERVLQALGRSGQPMGVRALSSELGVAPDLLAAPLRELRSAGRIAKHGEKRATTYSL